AGPIERADSLIPQFKREHTFDFKRVSDGLKLMAWGFFKKLVIADRVSILVNTVYNNPHEYNGISLMIATVFFAFQIYCDFSGYSDIAIGAAQVMGFKLMDNFNRPYFSKSISEFWKRWHISLSSWFKEYLYITLGGNRVPAPRMYFNLFFTFLVSGLWHGANWTFVIWGALNGFYLIFSILTEKYRLAAEKFLMLSRNPLIYKYYKVGVTFCLTCFAWIFFRSNNINDAIYVITHIFGGTDNLNVINIFGSRSMNDFLQNLYQFKLYIERLGLTKWEFVIAVLSIIFMEFVHLIQRHGQIRHMLSEKPLAVRWGVYLAILLAIANLSMGQKTPFIYFQF
ncbi:MAG TPA: MBOAT family O-acyltransferase, partial [Candidatus Goldiibacteriota bacterium]|nr:MBOAT family O-acyltransferase [Candidatus Goldiibacteriota bacterium]